jgi:hypothetical protein
MPERQEYLSLALTKQALRYFGHQLHSPNAPISFASASFSYRTTNELLDERAAKVLDSLLLLGRKAKLVEEAANLTSSNAFDAVDY